MAYLLYKHIKAKRAAAAAAASGSEGPAGPAKEKTGKPPKPVKLCEHQREINLDNIGLPTDISDFATTPQALDENPKQLVSDNAEATGNIVPCVLCKQEKRAARIYRWKLIGGLFFPFTVQALDTTIVAGALPYIASDFHELAQLNWIVTAFNLTSATFIPAWGQVADIFGRYGALQVATTCMLIGSALCAGAPVTAFPMLLFGRALLGMGCAGLNIVIKTVLADKVSLEENAKNNTIFTLVAGIGYGIGPTIGGYLTSVSWRWVFIINIPLGLIGMVGTHFLLRSELLGPKPIILSDGMEDGRPATFLRRVATIDVGGQFFFLFGMGLLILAVTWGGSYYSWTDVKVLAPLIVGGILLLSFMIWEYFMAPGNYLANRFPYRKAMIPLSVLTTRNARIIIYLNFITGMAMYAVFYFVDLYFSIVLQYGPGKSGTNIIYYLPGLSFGVYGAIFFLNAWPRRTFPPLFLGTLVEPLGITLLAHALTTESTGLIFGMLALTGVGTGIRLMPGTLHGVAYYPHNIAPMVSLLLLSSSLGGALGLTIMDNIFNSRISHAGFSFSSSDMTSLSSIVSLDDATKQRLVDVAKRGIVLAFYAITAFSWLGMVSMAGLGNVRIGKRANGKKSQDQVWMGSYVVGLLMRRKNGWGVVDEDGRIRPAEQ